MKEKEQKFYKKHYEDIKNAEAGLLKEINAILQPINQQSETKLIEHITSRVKTPESTIEKLITDGYEPTEENAIRFLSDVIGVRLVVHFISNIYTIRDILVNCEKFDVLKEKDYVKNEKEAGYRAYHIIIEKEVDGFRFKAEIQIRTIAMDCWASLEHQLRYKKMVKNAELIDAMLRKCSDDLMAADIEMEQISELIKQSEANTEGLFEDAMNFNKKQQEEKI